MMLSDMCLSRTSGLSREQRGIGRLKLAQRLPKSHLTRTPLARSKGQRSRSPGRFIHRGVNASGSCSGDRGNVLTMGTYCYVAVCRRGRLGGARRFCAHRGRRGAGAYCGGRPPTACCMTGQSHGMYAHRVTLSSRLLSILASSFVRIKGRITHRLKPIVSSDEFKPNLRPKSTSIFRRDASICIARISYGNVCV